MLLSLHCNKSIKRILVSCVVGLLTTYAIGLPYMAVILNVYMQKSMSAWQILMSGMVIFLPFDALKILATILLSKPLLKVMDHINPKSEQTGDDSK